jgi:hypothetical protein
MGDNHTDRGPADRSRVNLDEEWERRYWTKDFKVGEEELRAAVAVVGVAVGAVRAQLRH